MILKCSNPRSVQCTPLRSSTLNQCAASESEGSEAMVVIGCEPFSLARVCGEPKYILGDWSSLEYLKAQISRPFVKAQEIRMGSSDLCCSMIFVISRRVACMAVIGSCIKPLLSAN